MSDVNPSTINYGSVSFTVNDLPPVSLRALAQKGLAHYLGNEMASKVTSWKENFRNENNGAEPSKEQIDAQRAVYQTQAVEAIQNGTMGANTRGPRGSAVETLMRQIAEKELRAALKGNGITMPSGKDTVGFPTGETDADGKPVLVHFTRAQMIDRRLGHATHGPRIRKAAEKEQAALERLAKQTGEATSGSGLDLLDA